jgi:oxygen-independent coproporphyrinogen-3 oxidase
MTAHVPAELLAKYGTRGPRYTSYPTAPHFTPDVDTAAVARAWRAAHADLSLYMHVPYCQVRCTFCGCHVKITRHRERSTPYVDGLLRELDLASDLVDLSRPLRQVQLGGGTPNFLLPDEMRRLIEGVRARMRPAADAEWAIECDPRTLEAPYVDMLLDLGMNRFSLGVQDLDPDVMAAVNRDQSLATVAEVVAMLRSRGPVPLNLDLIHGLPRQTPASWARTLASILELRPTRLAVFGYAHVPWLKPHQRALERAGLPGPELRAELAAAARERFLHAGYVEIGMDHYALPDDELALALRDGTLHRNFMGYTTRRGLDLLAIGVSAISRVGSSYAQDEKDVPAWQASLEAGRMPWERGLLLTDDDVLRGEIITELSCNARVDIAAFERAHDVSFARAFASEIEALRDMERDGLLRLTDTSLEMTEIGRYLVRNACMVFDAWLSRDAEAPGLRYSTTT